MKTSEPQQPQQSQTETKHCVWCSPEQQGKHGEIIHEYVADFGDMQWLCRAHAAAMLTLSRDLDRDEPSAESDRP